MTRIILLSDGTGNSAGKVWRTNVWRLFQLLDLKSSGQIAIYDDGVGTSSFKPLAILGGAFGYGLKRNVINLYKFLSRNYKDGDQIYGFGFSRGAFTIRVVMGLVLSQGLIKFSDEADLDKKARAAYRAYHYSKHSWVNLGFFIRFPLWLVDKISYRPGQQRPVESIEFLGLWDTVAAYGLPIDEMTRGVDKWIWPLELPNKDFNSKINRARHALAIDDERQTFFPVLWNENSENTQPTGAQRDSKSEQLLQVWFAGVHSNVGGGYPDDSLANVSLSWMLAEAEAAGLTFKKTPKADPDALISTDSAKDKDGRLYDSRSGLGGYYRYSPRKIQEFYDAMPRELDKDNKPLPAPLPKIHESVFGRIRVGAHIYAPSGLPKKYEIVRSGDVNITGSPPSVAPMSLTVEPNDDAIAEGETKATQRHQQQEGVWNLVWRKRLGYFLTVVATADLLLYPLYRESYGFEELRTRLRLLSDTIRLIGNALPGLASRWLDAYARDPAQFVISAGLVFFLLWISARLAGRINDRMRHLWNASLPSSNKPPSAKPPSRWRAIRRAVVVAMVAYVVFYPWLASIPVLDQLVLPEQPNYFLIAYLSGVVRWVLGAFLVCYFLPDSIVQPLRLSALYQALLNFFRYKLAPGLSALALMALAFGFLNHYAFNIRDSFGSFCTPTLGLDVENNGLGGRNTKQITFDISPEAKNQPNNLCISTGVYLKTGQSYVIGVYREPQGTDNNPKEGVWTFWGEESFMGGQPVSRLPWHKATAMIALYPLRRTLDRGWYSAILRVGSTGSEEDFLDHNPPAQSDAMLLDRRPEAIPKEEKLGEVFTPKRDGELYVYVKEPVLGWPGYELALSDWIGGTGSARITVTKR